MKAGKLNALVLRNVRRNFGHFAMSAIGIVVGIGALSFFVGLRNGVKRWIHSEDILPLNKIEVVPMRGLSAKKERRALDDQAVAGIRARREVRAAYPKMRFAFPGLATGGKRLFGQNIHIEFIGDGIDPDLVAGEKLAKRFQFVDFWATENPKRQCKVNEECPKGRICNPNTNSCTECDTDKECGAGKHCQRRTRMCIPTLRCWPKDAFVRDQRGGYAKDDYGHKVRKRSPHQDCWLVSGRFQCDQKTNRCVNYCDADAQCGRFYYCDTDATNTCYRAVPALMSKYILELYNSSIAPARNWPRISKFFASMFYGLTFTAKLGDTVVGGGRSDVRTRRIQLVGISRKAIDIGVTVPLGYVQRWNRAFALRDASSGLVRKSERFKYKTYSSVVVWLRSKDKVSSFSAYVKDQGFTVSESSAKVVGNFIDFVGLLLTIVSLVILMISAINIAHTYYMIITERRREIGIMRAVGANRWDIRRLILGEAFLLGLIGGTLGLGLGRGLGWLVDFISRRYVPQFMFKPSTYFDFTWWVWVGAIGFAVLFCLLGAIFPANRAAKMQPAAALAAQ